MALVRYFRSIATKACAAWAAVAQSRSCRLKIEENIFKRLYLSFPRKRESSVRWIPAFAGMTAVLMLATACGVKRGLITPDEMKAKQAKEESKRR